MQSQQRTVLEFAEALIGHFNKLRTVVGDDKLLPIFLEAKNIDLSDRRLGRDDLAQMVAGYEIAQTILFPTVRNKEIADHLASSVSALFSLKMFEKIFGADVFSAEWAKEDARARWFALGFICLIACAASRKWNRAFPEPPLGLEVHKLACSSLLDRIRRWYFVPEPETKKMQSFVIDNHQEIYDSLMVLADPSLSPECFERYCTEWFERYCMRIYGMNPPWDVRAGSTEGGREFPVERLGDLRAIGSVFTETVNKLGDEVLRMASRSNQA